MAKRKKFGGTLTERMAKAAEAGAFVPAPPNSPPAAAAGDADTATATVGAPPRPSGGRRRYRTRNCGSAPRPAADRDEPATARADLAADNSNREHGRGR